MPDFRVTVDDSDVDTPAEVTVNTSLNDPLSTAQFDSESPLFDSWLQVSRQVVKVYIDKELVFTGNADMPALSLDGKSKATRFTTGLRSLARNFLDSDISSDPSVNLTYENQSLGGILNLTAASQGFTTSYNVGAFDNGASQAVLSFQWETTDKIGNKLRSLCEEHGTVLTDNANGQLRILNSDDFNVGSDNFQLTDFKKMDVSVDLTKQYRRFAGYATINVGNNQNSTSDTISYFIQLEVQGQPRNFAKKYTTVQNESELRRAVLYDAYRRQYSGLKVEITFAGLNAFKKGTIVTLSLPEEEARGLAVGNWVIASVNWKKSAKDGSNTLVTLLPARQFTNPDSIDRFVNPDAVDSGFSSDVYRQTLEVYI